MKHLSQEIDVFLPLLKSITRGKCTIALAGAHAKGLADDISDIDFHVFLDVPKSHSEITELFRDIADEGTLFVTEEFNGSAFGGIISFFYKGNEIGILSAGTTC